MPIFIVGANPYLWDYSQPKSSVIVQVHTRQVSVKHDDRAACLEHVSATVYFYMRYIAQLSVMRDKDVKIELGHFLNTEHNNQNHSHLPCGLVCDIGVRCVTAVCA